MAAKITLDYLNLTHQIEAMDDTDYGFSTMSVRDRRDKLLGPNEAMCALLAKTTGPDRKDQAG